MNSEKTDNVKTDSNFWSIERIWAIIVGVCVGILFLSGRIHEEEFYKALGLPLSFLEWTWQSSIISGGLILMTEIIYLLVLAILYPLIVFVCKQIRKKMGGGITSGIVINSGFFFVILLPLYFILQHKANNAREKGEDYLKEPIIVSYSTNANRSVNKEAMLVYKSPSNIHYLREKKSDGVWSNIIAYNFSDFSKYQILKTDISKIKK